MNLELELKEQREKIEELENLLDKNNTNRQLDINKFFDERIMDLRFRLSKIEQLSKEKTKVLKDCKTINEMCEILGKQGVLIK